MEKETDEKTEKEKKETKSQIQINFPSKIIHFEFPAD